MDVEPSCDHNVSECDCRECRLVEFRKIANDLSTRPSCSVGLSTCGLASVDVCPRFEFTIAASSVATPSSPVRSTTVSDVPVSSCAVDVMSSPVSPVAASSVPVCSVPSSPVSFVPPRRPSRSRSVAASSVGPTSFIYRPAAVSSIPPCPVSSVVAPPSPVSPVLPRPYRSQPVAPPAGRASFTCPAPVWSVPPRPVCSVPVLSRPVPPSRPARYVPPPLRLPPCPSFLPRVPVVCLVLVAVPVLLATPFGFVLSFLLR